jgi:putative FmdB family regulatory protein
MPLYEYLCDACAHRFEVIQKYSDAPIDVCPKCAGSVHKLLSSPAIQFKGSGWYITDYARAGKKDSATTSSGKSESSDRSESSSASSESKSESKNEGKSDSKSESKSESGSKTSNQPSTSSGASKE